MKYEFKLNTIDNKKVINIVSEKESHNSPQLYCFPYLSFKIETDDNKIVERIFELVSLYVTIRDQESVHSVINDQDLNDSLRHVKEFVLNEETDESKLIEKLALLKLCS